MVAAKRTPAKRTAAKAEAVKSTPTKADGLDESLEDSIVVTMVVQKETPGTFRYAQEEDSAHAEAGIILPTLYVRREGTKLLGNPMRVEVTIRPLD